MQLRENSIAAETHGLQSTNTFNIRLNPKAFEILSAQIYKDRILAPIRELICNAYDAAKEDFEVVLPTALNSTFAVRDYGPGLSHNDVTTLYTTYFDSTKGHNNDAIGGFGLGSKSPFAYTDQFTVDSWHNGMRRSYVCYRDKGIPTISLISEQATPDRNGLRVSFAVKPEDRTTFVNKFIEFARFVPFKIRNNAGAEPTSLIKLTDVISYEPHNNTTRVDPYRKNLIMARMGLVCYSIVDAQDICKFPFPLSTLFQHKSTIIDFPIGSLSIAPSRETLSYDEPTKQLISKTITEYRNFVISAAKIEFDKIKSTDPWFDQIKAHISIRNKFPAAVQLGLQVPDKWEKLLSTDKFCGEQTATYTSSHRINYGDLIYRLYYEGNFDPNTEVKINTGTLLEGFFNSLGIKLNCLHYQIGTKSAKTISATSNWDAKLRHEFFTDNVIYIIKSKDTIVKPSQSRLCAWYVKNNTYYSLNTHVFFNADDQTKLINWLNENIFIKDKAKVVTIDYDSYVAQPIKRVSKPATVFRFDGNIWNDDTITIQEDKDTQHYYVLSDAKYIKPSARIFKILFHLTSDAKTFIAFPKSRYDALKKKADAAGWKHYKDYDFSKVNWQIFSNIAASWEVLHNSTELFRLLIVLKDAGYKFPTGWNDVIDGKELIKGTYFYDYMLTEFIDEFGLTIPPPTVKINAEEICKLFDKDWLSTYRGAPSRWTDKQIIQIFKGN